MSSSSSSSEESNIAISKGSTSHASLISSCRKLVADASPPVQTVNVGTLTSLSPHGDDTAGAGKNLNVSKSLAARKSTVRNKKGFTGVAKSCRMLAERGSVVEDDLNITYENRGQADGFAKTNSNGQQQEKKRESYRGVSYFLNRQDELDPDLLSDPAPIVDEYNLPRGAATIDTKYLIQDTSESEFNGSVEHGGKLQISFNDAAVNRLHDPTEWDPMDDSDDASRQVINHKNAIYKNKNKKTVSSMRRELSNDYDSRQHENYIELPPSTHTLLHTEPVCSVAFLFSLCIAVLSAMCLILVLVSELKPGEAGNWLDVPTGITTSVTIAQYCGIFVGLLMEEEIPQGLILMRAISRQSFHESYPDLSYNRFVLSCLLRLVMGYLFLLNLFVTVVQADDVITIFFDILALEFVQHLDDMAFELGRKDILGRHLNVATCMKYKVITRISLKRMQADQDEENALIDKKKQQNGRDDKEDEWRFYCLRRRKKFAFTWILKATYFINCAALLTGTIIVGERQQEQYYHCNSVTITFGDQVWEEAFVTNATNQTHIQQRTLIYSYFNGVYEITGRDHLGYPIYTEMNKNTGEPYQATIGAEIVYCEEEEAWIFRHELISKRAVVFDDESGCSQWLLRSPKTKVYDLIDVPREDWSVWTGIIEPGNQVSIVCNVCQRDSDCNYNGECTDDGKCMCNHEFKEACPELIDDEGEIYSLAVSGNNQTFMSYSRPIYLSRAFDMSLIFSADSNQTSTSFDSTFAVENLDSPNSTTALHQTTNVTKTCHPEAKRIRLEATTGAAISMFELQAYSSGVNVALLGTANQSSSLNELFAYKAIDGSYSTYSQTNDSNAFWELILPRTFPIENVLIVNADCGEFSSADQLGCLCRLSNATLVLLDEFGEVATTRTVGDTCQQRTIFETFYADRPCPIEIVSNLPETVQSVNSTTNNFTLFNQTNTSAINLDFGLYFAIALVYSGSRWFGTIEFGTDENFELDSSLYGDEYHAFWDELYEGRTFFLSDPTTDSTPVGADIYENAFMTLTSWDDYGPYGFLKPAHNISGKGYFHCLGTNSTPVKVSSGAEYGE